MKTTGGQLFQYNIETRTGHFDVTQDLDTSGHGLLIPYGFGVKGHSIFTWSTFFRNNMKTRPGHSEVTQNFKTSGHGLMIPHGFGVKGHSILAFSTIFDIT